MNFDKLTNQELFDWLKKHPSKSGVIEAEKRWTDFWKRAKIRLTDAYSKHERIDSTIYEIESKLTKLERSLCSLHARQNQLRKANIDKRLALIRANLQSITEQIKDREPDPTPYVPVEQWEAFQAFLSKLGLNHKRPNKSRIMRTSSTSPSPPLG